MTESLYLNVYSCFILFMNNIISLFNVLLNLETPLNNLTSCPIHRGSENTSWNKLEGLGYSIEGYCTMPLHKIHVPSRTRYVRGKLARDITVTAVTPSLGMKIII